MRVDIYNKDELWMLMSAFMGLPYCVTIAKMWKVKKKEGDEIKG